MVRLQNRYQIGDQVFAKVKGFSPWPAIIVSEEKGSKFKVFFRDTNQNATVKEEFIWAYEKSKEKFASRYKKNKPFSKAMEMMEEMEYLDNHVNGGDVGNNFDEVNERENGMDQDGKRIDVIEDNSKSKGSKKPRLHLEEIHVVEPSTSDNKKRNRISPTTQVSKVKGRKSERLSRLASPSSPAVPRSSSQDPHPPRSSESHDPPEVTSSSSHGPRPPRLSERHKTPSQGHHQHLPREEDKVKAKASSTSHKYLLDEISPPEVSKNNAHSQSSSRPPIIVKNDPVPKMSEVKEQEKVQQPQSQEESQHTQSNGNVQSHRHHEVLQAPHHLVEGQLPHHQEVLPPRHPTDVQPPQHTAESQPTLHPENGQHPYHQEAQPPQDAAQPPQHPAQVLPPRHPAEDSSSNKIEIQLKIKMTQEQFITVGKELPGFNAFATMFSN